MRTIAKTLGKIGLLLLALGLVQVKVLRAQDSLKGDSSKNSPKPWLLDQVVAMIGDKMILWSDLRNQITDMQQRGVALNEHTECDLLQEAIATKAMEMQAIKDSLLVSDEEVDAELDNRIRYYINLYGSKTELEQIAGKNIFQMKEDFREPIREGLLARNMQKKIMQDVKVTPAEVRSFFESQKPQDLSFYELELELAQIVLYPKVSKEVENFTIEELRNLKKRVETGQAKFEKLAKIYSDDPGSRDKGGYYELNKNEKQWDPVFLSTAFRLQPGEISPVVRSKFGFHIIQMVSRYGDDIAVRHILKIPPISDEDMQQTMEKMQKIRSELQSGRLSFERAVALYSEDETSAFTGGFITGKNQSSYVTIDQLDRSIVAVLDKLKIRGYSEPFTFTDERGKKGVRLLYLKDRIEPHRENLAQDYLKIVEKLMDKKRKEKLRDWLANKVATFYLEVDKERANCNHTIENWVKTSQKIGSELR